MGKANRHTEDDTASEITRKGELRMKEKGGRRSMEKMYVYVIMMAMLILGLVSTVIGTMQPKWNKYNVFHQPTGQQQPKYSGKAPSMPEL